MERISERQKLRLLDLMSRHYTTLFGRFTKVDGAKHKAEIWKKIQTDLNTMGPKKTLDQWKRCWRDLKKGAKTKLMEIRKYRNHSGGGPPCPVFLTDHDSIIITICNLDALDGVQGQELGMNQTPPHTSSVRSPGALSPSNDDSFHGFVRSSNETRSRSRSTTRRDLSLCNSGRSTSCKSQRTASRSSDAPIDRQSTSTVHSIVSEYREPIESSTPLSIIHGQPWNRWASFTSTLIEARTQPIDREVSNLSETEPSPQSASSVAHTHSSIRRSPVKSSDIISISNSSSRSIHLDHRSTSGVNANNRKSLNMSGRNSHSSSRCGLTTLVEETNGQAGSSFHTTSSQQPACTDQGRCQAFSNVSGRHTNSISQRNLSTRIDHSSSSHRLNSTSRTSIQRSTSSSLLNSNDRNSMSNTSSRSIDEGHRSRSVLSSISGVSANSPNSISILSHRDSHSSSRRISATRAEETNGQASSSFDTAFSSQQPVRADQERYGGLTGSRDTISNVSGRHTNSISQRNSSTRIGHSSSSHRSSSISRASNQRSRSRSLLNSNDRNLISDTSSRSIDEGHRSRSILSSISGVSANNRSSISTLSRRDSHSSSRRISTARSEETNGQASSSFDTAFSFQQPSRADQHRYRALSGSRDTISNVSGRRTNSIPQRSSSTRIGHISRSHRSSFVSRASINSRSSISNMSRGSTYSGRSFQSDSQLSDPATQSRRNLTGTLARSVQNAAVVQQNIDRNILSLRDGQEDIVTVLRECLDELRRRNDFPNEFSLRNT